MGELRRVVENQKFLTQTNILDISSFVPNQFVESNSVSKDPMIYAVNVAGAMGFG